jgi:hypothetical protein
MKVLLLLEVVAALCERRAAVIDRRYSETTVRNASTD